MEFKIGDLVELKSGGPVMTVVQLTELGPNKDQIRCQWFSGRKAESDWFPASALNPAEEEKPGK